MRFALFLPFLAAAALSGSDLRMPEAVSIPTAPARIEATAKPSAPGPAAERLAGPFPAETTAVIDGDTIEARVTIWLGQQVTTRVRLRGIDAPELGSDCGEERRLAEAARAALQRLVSGSALMLVDVGRDKYGGRVLAKVVSAQGGDVGAQLLAGGFARPYQGGRRGGWCPGPTARR